VLSEFELPANARNFELKIRGDAHSVRGCNFHRLRRI
jgi:hypothetical protein